MRNVLRFFRIAIFSLLLGSSGFSDVSSQPRVIFPKKEEGQIKFLVWDAHPVVLNAVLSGAPQSVTLHGFYQILHSTLMTQEGSMIDRDEKGKFETKVTLTGESTEFELTSIDSFGKIERETITVLYQPPPPAPPQPEVRPPPEPAVEPSVVAKRLNITPGVGVSSITQVETKAADYTTLALTAKTTVNYRLFPPKWDLGFSGYFTLLQLSKNQDFAVRYFGLNARMGYVVPIPLARFALILYGGFYYTTMLAPIGYTNISGPQVYPVVRYLLNDRNSMAGYYKFSPIASGLSFLDFTNREIAWGLGFSHHLKDSHWLGVSMDTSQLDIQVGKRFHGTRTMTFGLSYSL